MKRKMLNLWLIIAILDIVLCTVFNVFFAKETIFRIMEYLLVGLILFTIYYIHIYFANIKCVKLDIERGKQICELLNYINILFFSLMSIVWFMIIITKSCIIPINTNFIFYEQIFAFVLLSQVIIALKFRL